MNCLNEKLSAETKQRHRELVLGIVIPGPPSQPERGYGTCGHQWKRLSNGWICEVCGEQTYDAPPSSPGSDAAASGGGDFCTCPLTPGHLYEIKWVTTTECKHIACGKRLRSSNVCVEPLPEGAPQERQGSQADPGAGYVDMSNAFRPIWEADRALICLPS